MESRTVLLFLAAFLALQGCGRTAPPAPFVRYGATAPNGAGVVSARAGDTVYKIASFYNVPVRDLIEANNLSPPYNLEIGQRIEIPPPQEYRVQLSDTIYSISRAFDVEQSQLVKGNNIEWPYYLKPGQVLRLPRYSGAGDTVVAETFAPSAVAPPPSLSPSYATTPVAPRPDAVTAEALPPPPSASSSSSLSSPVQQKSGMPSVQEAKPATASAPAAAPATAAISSTGKFIWPVQGKVLSAFGPKSDGLHNDGLNIAAPRGTAVRAADGGVVAYVGDDLKSYGNLVLLRHENGWMTAYSHLNKALVSRGDTITRGQAIGTIGSTGSVDSPQLHFEIRQGNKALDPQRYLGTG